MAQAGFLLPLDGGCRCGAIRYRVTGMPAFTFACHCTDCRQLTASAFSIGLAVPEDGFAVVDGEPRIWRCCIDPRVALQVWLT